MLVYGFFLDSASIVLSSFQIAFCDIYIKFAGWSRAQGFEPELQVRNEFVHMDLEKKMELSCQLTLGSVMVGR